MKYLRRMKVIFIIYFWIDFLKSSKKSYNSELISPKMAAQKKFSMGNLEKLWNIIDKYLISSKIFIEESKTGMKKAVGFKDLNHLSGSLFKARRYLLWNKLIISHILQLHTYWTKVICSNFKSKVRIWNLFIFMDI